MQIEQRPQLRLDSNLGLDGGSVGSDCWNALSSLLERLGAVSETANSFGEHLSRMDSSESIAQELRDRLPPEMSLRVADSVDSEPPDLPEGVESIASRSSEGTQSETTLSFSDVQEMTSTLNRMFKSGDHAAEAVAAGIVQTINRTPRTELVYQSLVAMVVAGYEAFLASVWRAIYTRRSDLLNQNEDRYSLADIAAFETLDDAVQESVARQVDALMTGSLESWKSWYGKQKIAKFEELADSYDAVQEIFQRRHIIAHNDGRISQRYIDALDGLFEPGDAPVEGWLPVTDHEYVVHAIHEITVFAAGLAVAVARKFDSDTYSAFVMTVNTNTSFEMMKREEWATAACIASHLVTCETDSVHEWQKWATRCNLWFCRKQLGESEAVTAEVASWDTTAMEPSFQLVKRILLDDIDGAFELVGVALKQGALGSSQLNEWPILKPLRDDARFEALIAQTTEPE